MSDTRTRHQKTLMDHYEPRPEYGPNDESRDCFAPEPRVFWFRTHDNPALTGMSAFPVEDFLPPLEEERKV